MPMPSISITNKPSSGTSLYHTCRSVLDKLALVEGMSYYLEFENLNLVQSSSGSSVISSESGSTSSSTSNDPLSKLWDLCRRGAPLATLFNALNPDEPLKIDFTQNQQVNECKKTVYHFIVACRNQLKFNEEDLFTLSDLYKDNTNGFVKVVNTIDLILQLLEEKGIISSLSDNRNSMNAPKDTRDKVVHELLETERKYVQDLEVLQNYMRELQIQEILSPDTVHYLFGNLNTLVDFQRRFLIYLEEIGEKSPEEQNFGLLFSQMEEQFTVYEPYCSNYFSAQDLVVQEAPKLQKLANILNPQYELPSMLIKPVQRICKYPLLLQQLIKATPSDWPHFDDMEIGLDSVKRVTERVNETQRKHENIQVVDDLKKRVDEVRIGQIDNYGSLLLHDKLILQQTDGSEKEMYIFFFEKTMLICKETKDATKNKVPKANTISIKKKRRGSLQPRGLIVISRVLSVRNLSTGEGHWFLRIDWKDNEVDHILLRFRNEEQVKLWESTLKRRMSPIKSNVSNTQLASMKYTMQHVPASFRTDDEDVDTEDEPQEEEEELELPQSRSRSNSISAHLFNTISGRPKMPRNMSADTKQRYTTTPLPRTSASAGTHTPNDYHYPASPPPSNPSSPTTSSRVSQSANSSIRLGMRDSSPLADIATKFMNSQDYADEYKHCPPSIINRSQSHSAATPAYPPTPGASIPPMYLQQSQQLPRLRSQSSPNIHHNHPLKQHEDMPQLPFNSRTLYQMPPSPLDSPVRTTQLQPPSSPNQSGALKIKLNYNDGIYVVMCFLETTFDELMEKVERKIRLIANLQPHGGVLRLKYQDEDGDLITINSDEDVQMAFESKGNANTINLFVSA
ncbi:uncharacterized protein B0P05DRAFT_468116 [Gilbertella persicaria]|nr:uncharacterized protein B0P05DRAFT_468116 [Gilbertella persicaria]KAI8082502.1 hypothetical protein B0P05DRAFT_468116 [Gilbertella persicaria]